MKNGALEFTLRVAVIVIVVFWLGDAASDFVASLIAPIKAALI